MRRRCAAGILVRASALLLVAVPAMAQVPCPPLPGAAEPRRPTGSGPRQGAVGLSAVALAYRAEHQMRYLGTTRNQSGTWFGGEAQLSAGPVALSISGVAGKLKGQAGAMNPDRSVRVSAASLGIRPIAWFEVGADVAARRVQSPASVVVTRLFGGHARIAIPLGVDGLSGNATAVYFPATAVTGDEKLTLALSGELGFTYAPSSRGVAMRLAYRFERYDYSAAALGPARLEQQQSLVAGIGVKF